MYPSRGRTCVQAYLQTYVQKRGYIPFQFTTLTNGVRLVVCNNVRNLLVISTPLCVLLCVLKGRSASNRVACLLGRMGFWVVPIEPASPLADLVSLRMCERDLWQQFVKRTIVGPFYHLPKRITTQHPCVLRPNHRTLQHAKYHICYPYSHVLTVVPNWQLCLCLFQFLSFG